MLVLALQATSVRFNIPLSIKHLTVADVIRVQSAINLIPPFLNS